MLPKAPVRGLVPILRCCGKWWELSERKGSLLVLLLERMLGPGHHEVKKLPHHLLFAPCEVLGHHRHKSTGLSACGLSKLFKSVCVCSRVSGFMCVCVRACPCPHASQRSVPLSPSTLAFETEPPSPAQNPEIRLSCPRSPHTGITRVYHHDCFYFSK